MVKRMYRSSEGVGNAQIRKLSACKHYVNPYEACVYNRRFWALLSVAAMKGIFASIEGVGEIDDSGPLVRAPCLEELLAGLDVPPEVSRLA